MAKDVVVAPADTEDSTDEHRELLDCFAQAADAERPWRVNAVDDLWYSLDGNRQWNQRWRTVMEQDNYPCISVPILNSFVHQITNEERKNIPAIKVIPEDGACPDFAEVREGRITQIQYESKATQAYATAGEFAARCGRGVIYAYTYWKEGSFRQEIGIGEELNPMAWYFDPNSMKSDFTDMRYQMRVETMSRRTYRARFGNSKMAANLAVDNTGNIPPRWLKGDDVQVASCWRLVEDKRTLVMLSVPNPADPTKPMQGYEDDMPDAVKALIERGDIRIVAKRPDRVRRIEYRLINGSEILEKGVWPSKYMPGVPVYGERMLIDGEIYCAGVVRAARDTQMAENMYASAELKAVALAPNSPFMAAVGSIEGLEQFYQDSNIRNYAVLPFNAYDDRDRPLPAPARNVAEPAIQAISYARAQNTDATKRVIGIYNAALGAEAPAKSGRALAQQRAEADTSNFHYPDNLRRGVEQVGRVVNDLMDKIYVGPLVKNDETGEAMDLGPLDLRISMADGSQKTVRANEPTKWKGQDKCFEFGKGSYSVAITTGPAYTTMRQEAVDMLMQFAQAWPQVIPYIASTVMKFQDFPGAQEISEMLKSLIPPGAQQSDEEQQIPPQLMQKMQQYQQAVDALTKVVNEQAETIKTDRIKSESQEKIQASKNAVELQKAALQALTDLAKTGSSEAVSALKLEMQRIETLANLNQAEVARADAREIREQELAVQAQNQPQGVQ